MDPLRPVEVKRGRASALCLVMTLACVGALGGCAASRAPVAAPSDALLSTRLRRLSNVEYERSVNALLGTSERLRDALPPDERQDGYTINEVQALPSYYAAELSRVADELAERAATERLTQLIPCPPSDGARSPCVTAALARLGLAAFRRPPTAEERAALLGMFERGAQEASRAESGSASERAAGTSLVLASLLVSPSLLYLSELGRAGAAVGPLTTLEPYEIASSLAYAVSGAPPDAELLAAAADPERLLDPREREAEARRLLGLSTTREHFRQFMLEWLEVDQLERTAKAPALVAGYDEMKSHMLAETTAFVDEVMVHGGASLASLLDARFTSPDATMAAYYGIRGFAGPRVSLTRQGRVGVLEQASFLSAHAYEDVTSPIKRGDFVLRRVLCVELPRPGELGIDTTLPPRDEHATTRERFAAHTSNASCRSCHASIDPLGFSFERFDAAGRYRTAEHARPVTTGGEFTLSDRTLRFRDSAELSAELARAPEARSCFARQALRYLTGRRSATAEQWFGGLVDALPEAQRDSVLEWVVAWVKSPEFILRRRAS